MKKFLTLVLALAMVATFGAAAGAEEVACDGCPNCDTEYQCIVAIEGGLETIGTVEEDPTEEDETVTEEVDRSELARDAEGGEDGKQATGAVGVAILGGVAVMAAGAVVITRKRK
jgi:hypothetical protein